MIENNVYHGHVIGVDKTTFWARFYVMGDEGHDIEAEFYIGQLHPSSQSFLRVGIYITWILDLVNKESILYIPDIPSVDIEVHRKHFEDLLREIEWE